MFACARERNVQLCPPGDELRKYANLFHPPCLLSPRYGFVTFHTVLEAGVVLTRVSTTSFPGGKALGTRLVGYGCCKAALVERVQETLSDFNLVREQVPNLEKT